MLASQGSDSIDIVVGMGGAGLDAREGLDTVTVVQECVEFLGCVHGFGINGRLGDFALVHRRDDNAFLGDRNRLGERTGLDGQAPASFLRGRIGINCNLIGNGKCVAVIDTVLNRYPVKVFADRRAGRGGNGKGILPSCLLGLNAFRAERDAGRSCGPCRLRVVLAAAGPQGQHRGKGYTNKYLSFHKYRFFTTFRMTEWNPEGGSAPSGLKRVTSRK